MRLKLLHCIAVFIIAQVFLAHSLIAATVNFGDPKPERIEAWKKLLNAKPQGVGPTINDRAAWNEIAQRPSFKKVITDAENLARSPMKPLTDELYLDYSRTGVREPCQKRIYERRDYFNTLVYAECCENKGRFLPAIETAIRDFCAQKTWLYPAHDPDLGNFRGQSNEISICSSALSWDLATANYWLGDRLKPATKKLLSDNFEKRTYQAVESLVRTGKPHLRWLTADGNHNSVTLAGAIGTAMTHLESRERRAYLAAVAEKFIENFYSGYTPDGYCSEGIDYWNYGFGRYVMLSETLRLASDGQVNWLDMPRIKPMTLYGRKMEIQPGIYPIFADGGVGDKADATLMRKLSLHFGWSLKTWEAAGFDKASRPQPHLFEFGMNQIAEPSTPISKSNELTPDLPLRDFFPDGGVLICRPKNGGTFGVALKGGHNCEEHNHNDLGQFVVVQNKTSVIIDPGAEVYTSRTFTPRRYKSDVLNSFGHCVPRVAGKLQSSGCDSKATILRSEFTDAADTFKLDLTSAYDVPELKSLKRTFVYSRVNDGELRITDDVAFEKPNKFETALITFLPWKKESANRIWIGEGNDAVIVEIAVQGAEVNITSQEIHEDLPHKQFPTRIKIEFAAPIQSGQITTVIRPAK